MNEFYYKSSPITACGHNNHDNANEKTSKIYKRIALQKAAKEYRKYTNEQLDQFLKELKNLYLQ